MCLYTDYKTPIIATEPIRVWKRLLPTGAVKANEIIYMTPYQHIWVRVDETLKGLFPNEEVRESINLKKYIVSAQGVHAYISRNDAEINKCSYEIITEWEIPAGAKYWIGTGYSGDEIAATEMKFIKVCED